MSGGEWMVCLSYLSVWAGGAVLAWVVSSLYYLRRIRKIEARSEAPKAEAPKAEAPPSDEFADFDRDLATINSNYDQVDETNRVLAEVLEKKGVARVTWSKDGHPLEIAIPVEGLYPGKKTCRLIIKRKNSLSSLLSEPDGRPR